MKLQNNELNNLLGELFERKRSLEEEIQSKGQEIFKQYTKELFEKIPQLKGIKWTQYTPYFNDGEECFFNVNDAAFTNAEGNDLSEVSSYADYSGDNENVWAISIWALTLPSEYYKKERELANLTQEQVELLDSFDGLIHSADFEDVMRMMFGDHVEVTATAQGFEVNEYEHD